VNGRDDRDYPSIAQSGLVPPPKDVAETEARAANDGYECLDGYRCTKAV
jgi:hypothetical protein